MILKIPLAIWFGGLTVISLFITAGLGVAVFKYHKNVFKYHKMFAITTITLAIIHVVFVVLLFFFGRVI
jgi:hypothetical protein